MDGFSQAALEWAKGAQSVSTIERYKIVTSTMDIIERRIACGVASDGHMAIATQQKYGRGSGGRPWLSPPGNVYLSRATHVEAHEFGQTVEMMAACAVSEIMRELLPHADIRYKYPNDVLVNGKKISGSIVSPIYDLVMGRERMVNLGVGINVAVAPMVSGKETTSLAAEGVTLSVDEIIGRFEARFSDIRAAYSTSSDFNIVLDRMGFLDANGQLTLHAPSHFQWHGVYAGFKTYVIDSVPTSWLLLTSEGYVYRHRVHTFEIESSKPPHRGLAPKPLMGISHASIR